LTYTEQAIREWQAHEHDESNVSCCSLAMRERGKV